MVILDRQTRTLLSHNSIALFCFMPIEPIKRVFIGVDNNTSTWIPSEDELYHSLTPPGENEIYHPLTPSGESVIQRAFFLEGSPQTIRCVVEGGYPLPQMSILFGDRDISGEFQMSNSLALHGTMRGLRTIRYRTELYCDRLTFTALDDNQPLLCVVKVAGMAANHSRVIVNVICKYMYM